VRRFLANRIPRLPTDGYREPPSYPLHRAVPRCKLCRLFHCESQRRKLCAHSVKQHRESGQLRIVRVGLRICGAIADLFMICQRHGTSPMPPPFNSIGWHRLSQGGRTSDTIEAARRQPPASPATVRLAAADGCYTNSYEAFRSSIFSVPIVLVLSRPAAVCVLVIESVARIGRIAAADDSMMTSGASRLRSRPPAMTMTSTASLTTVGPIRSVRVTAVVLNHSG